ncbi:MAG: lysophospholipid acyltransferase family protein [Candidatus Krumholzibacteria bacterium]|nr:lysophospholipid acyltransferase family protein [Candidatus Krumholzibacteria bacterium]
MRASKKIKHAMGYGAVRVLGWVARGTPRAIGHRVFSGLGRLAARILERDRRRAADNLALAFPEAAPMVRDAMVTAMFRALGRNVYEFLRLEGASPRALAERIDHVEGLERLERAYGAGRGLIVITGHIGCWELMPAYFVSRGYRVTAVARRVRTERFNERLVAVRRSVGVVSLDRDASPREMIAVLKRGEVLGVLIDQHTRVSGVYVPFFNRPALTPTAVAKLALMTGAKILPMGIFLNHRGKHVVHVLPEIEPPPAQSREASVQAMTAACSLAVERLIRIDPKQWVWFHQRWRETADAARG